MISGWPTPGSHQASVASWLQALKTAQLRFNGLSGRQGGGCAKEAEPLLRVSSAQEFSLPPYVKKKENNLTTTTQRNLDHFEKKKKESDLCEI